MDRIHTSKRVHVVPGTIAEPANNSVNQSVAQTIALAREWRSRREVGESNAFVRLDFHGLMRTAGRYMMAADVSALFAAFITAGLITWFGQSVFIGKDTQSVLSLYFVKQLIVFLSFGGIGLLWLGNHGHYRQRLPFWEMFGDILMVSGCGFVASGFVIFATKDDTSRMWMGVSWLMFLTLMLIGRYVVRHQLHRQGTWQIPALIVGGGHCADKTLRVLKADSQMGFSVIGQVPASRLDDMVKPEAWKHLLAVNSACHVFLTLTGSEMERHHMALKALTRARVPCSIIPPWLGMPTTSFSTHHFMMHDVMLMHDTNRLQLLVPNVLKRLFDITLSGLALLALSPVFLIVMLCVRRDGGPAFFRQNRVGRHGELFECFKFRSMRIDAEDVLESYLAKNPEAAAEWGQFQKLRDDVRITRFGQFIRRTSLDELPQLINVLRGDMSLVGPRPCMPGQENLYKEDFGYYTSVRPGITGPWQVSGRSKLTFNERVALEAWYVRNWNLWMDIVIVLKTLPVILGRDQAY